MSLVENDYFMPFKYYYQFYHENKEKIHMKQSDGIGQHPVNKEAVARWIERISRLENEEERKFYLFFARAFSSILETSYVPYTKFLSTINAMAEEIYQKIRTEKYKNIVFVIYGELEKSNVWISLLCMDYWDKISPFLFLPTWPGSGYGDKIQILSFNGEEPTISFDFLDIQNKKTLFLHFDDMSYSGGQAASAIHKLWQSASSPSTTSHTAAGASDTISITHPNVHYYLAMPYVTEVARAYILEHNPGVKLFDSTVRVPNFLEQVETFYNTLSESEKEENRIYFERVKDMCHNYWFSKVSNQPKHKVRSQVMPMNKIRTIKNRDLQYYGSYTPPEEFSKGVWAFRCSKFKTLIYFDHKLADDASTFQKVLYFGSYPINTKEETLSVCEHESLIQNCSVHPDVLQNMRDDYVFLETRRGTRSKNACRNYIQALSAKRWDINQRVICPKTFYKGIPYTYGVKIERVWNYQRSSWAKETEQAFRLNKRKILWENIYIYYTTIFENNIEIKYGRPYRGNKPMSELIEETVSALSKKQEKILTTPNTSTWVNIGNAIPNTFGQLGGRKTRKQKQKKKTRTRVYKY